MQPLIRIKYGKLIDPFFKEYVAVKYPGYVFPSHEAVLGKIVLFKDAWAVYEEKFFAFLQKETGLTFKRNIIDCYIVSATPRDMSAPLIIRSRWSGEEFVNTLMHELIHVLFSDNATKKVVLDKEVSPRTTNHVMVFALLKKFYLDILQDEEKFEKYSVVFNPEINKEYVEAWEIVNSVGYDAIIENINPPQ